MNEHYYKILGALDAYLNSPGVNAIVEADPVLKDAFGRLTQARDSYRAAGIKVEEALQKFDEEGGNAETGIGKLILDAITALRVITYPAAGPSVAAALDQIVSDIKTAPTTTAAAALVDPSSSIYWPRTSSSSSY